MAFGDSAPVPFEVRGAEAEAVRKFDLSKVPAAAPGKCGESAGEIVVCAQNPDQFRLKSLPDVPEEPPFGRAETTIGGVNVRARTESATVGGFTSKRIMLTGRIKF